MNESSKHELSSTVRNHQNHVRAIREDQMMSKAELARKANVTVQTIHRIENGKECRLDTKRKIILALGYTLSDRERVFFLDGEESGLPSKTKSTSPGY